MTSETHRSVTEVIREVSAQLECETSLGERALHCFEDELAALRQAERNILAQIHRLEQAQLHRLKASAEERAALAETSRVAIFDVLSAQNRRLVQRAHKEKTRWEETISTRITEALKEPTLQKKWSQVQEFKNVVAPTLDSVLAASKEVALAHQTSRLRDLRRELSSLMHQKALDTHSMVHLDLILTIEPVSENELGVTFVLPVSGTCLNSDAEETLESVLLYRVMEGIYVYLRQTPMKTGHIHVGAHDGLTVLELDVVTEAHIDEVTSSIKQYVSHHLMRVSDLRNAGVQTRVTVVDGNLLFAGDQQTEANDVR